jgi:hypothetical protein
MAMNTCPWWSKVSVIRSGNNTYTTDLLLQPIKLLIKNIIFAEVLRLKVAIITGCSDGTQINALKDVVRIIVEKMHHRVTRRERKMKQEAPGAVYVRIKMLSPLINAKQRPK